MSTTRLIDTKTVTYSYSEVQAMLEELYPFANWNVTVGEFFEQMSEAATDDFIELLIETMAPAVMPYASYGILLGEVIIMLQDAIKYEKIKPYLTKMTTASSRFKLTTFYYEWTSGSGNSTSYYAEEKYSVIK